MAMSEWMRGARGACDRYAPTLALLDDPAIDPAERAEALEHLAGCALCQADQAADERIDAALRRAFGPQSAASLRTRDLLLAIGATREPTPHIIVATASGAASPIRSVVDLGDFEGGFERMSESEGANGAANSAASGGASDETSAAAAQSGAQPAPARKMAAIPSLRPVPRHLGRSSSRVWAMGFSATAAAVILVVVAVTLFSSRGRAPALAGVTHNASATATAQWRAHMGALGPIYTISMDSPTDGWAIGDASTQNANGAQQVTAAAFYHYDGSEWRLSQTVQDFSIFGRDNATLTMFSPTDGWAVDGSANSILHYDGSTWRAVHITPAGNAQIAQLLAVDMVSPTEGWAAAKLGSDSPQGNLSFLRFDGQQWNVEPGSISMPGVDLNTVSIQGISALPDGEVWAIGEVIPFLTPNTSTSSQVGFIVHRTHGVWHLASELNQPFAATSVAPVDILMTSATTGWIVGSYQSVKSTSNGDMAITHALALHYDSARTGSRWVPVTLPIANPSQGDQNTSITSTGPNDVWVAGLSNDMNVTSSGLAISALLFHYDGTAWTQEPSTFPGVTGYNQVSVYTIAETPDGSLWGAGALYKEQSGQGSQVPFIASYHNGAWTVAPIATK
jgi:hypothetical protein